MATRIEMSTFANTIYKDKYAMEIGGRKEEWHETAARVVNAVVKPYLPALVDPIRELIEERKFIPGGRYLYSAGRRFQQMNNCFLFFAEDSREGWGSLMQKVTLSLMTGGGIGVVYSRLREENALIRGMGGKSTGPCALASMVNESGRYIMQGGSRRSAIWAGLHWNHPDVFKYIKLKDWPEEYRMCKKANYAFPLPMEGTNISVILDDDFFEAYHNPSHRDHGLAQSVYWICIESMLKTGEPGFSIDVGENAGEHARNACTEVCSADDNDMCNLGSLNLARIRNKDEMALATELGTAFLLCGTLASKLPIDCMYETRKKNRRLGLGLMGVHEWLLTRGYRYEPNQELETWLDIYANSGAYANRWANNLSVSRPVATRAVAPNGTIGIVGETTTSAEPIIAVASKRRYLKGTQWVAQYIVDPTAHRLIQNGVPVDLIEDSMTLAQDVERRIKFQSFLQKFVDHGISSTINLPMWGTEHNNEDKVRPFGERLMTYLPTLRGVTTYPDGARDGQPFVRVPYEEAISNLGVEFSDGSDYCKGGVCGS